MSMLIPHHESWAQAHLCANKNTMCHHIYLHVIFQLETAARHEQNLEAAKAITITEDMSLPKAEKVKIRDAEQYRGKET